MSIYTMTSLQDIHHVLSLRKSIRDASVPSPILERIETIHKCIASGSDQNGWKTVDWRGPGRKHAYTGNRSAVSRKPDAGGTIPLTNPVQETKRTAWHEGADGFRTHQKYVSKFKKTSEKVEDTILNTILLGKLNKFSQPNYNEIKEFITHIIDSGQTDMITCFMKLVFEKAASEEVFCPLYAKLLSELSILYPVLLTEMAKLYTQYMVIFEEVSDGTDETYHELCKRNVEKKYRRGYSQFLAELIKHDVVDRDTFMKIIMKIISQVERTRSQKESIKQNEEFADCVMKIMKALRTEKEDEESSETNLHAIHQLLKGDIVERIQPLTIRDPDMVGLSNKARFTFLDIYESITSLK